MSKQMTKAQLWSRKRSLAMEMVKSVPKDLYLESKGVFEDRDKEGYVSFSFFCETGVTYDLLKQLSEHFGTTHINVGDWKAGCDTCGDGSGIHIYVLKVEIQPPITSNMKNLTKEEASLWFSGKEEEAISLVNSRLGITKNYARKIMESI